MSNDERDLLILVAEGIRNKVVFELAQTMSVVAAGNSFFTGYSKSVTDRAMESHEEGRRWLSRLEDLLIRVKAERTADL